MESMNRKLIYCGEPVPELEHLQRAGWVPVFATSPEELLTITEQSGADIGILRLQRSDDQYLEKVEECLLTGGTIEWIALLNENLLDSDEIARFISKHFYDFHTIPIDPRRLEFCIGHACGMATLKKVGATNGMPNGTVNTRITGQSPKMIKLFKLLEKVIRADSAVLIRGESGTGKELVAREIHENSSRYKMPFIALNCGSLPEKLIQSELFGHEKGAFTGAIAQKKGKIEAASGGTIFLDEIGDLPYEAQVNLLRFLQEGTIERVGSTAVIHVDVRVIAATHVDLEKAITEGRFREDLYYRLNVLNLELPPLRDRGNDIELLATTFLEKFTIENPTHAHAFSKQAVTVMRRHSWPGNVRELMNRVQRAVIMADGMFISAPDLGLEDRCEKRSQHTLDHVRNSAEVKVIKDALFHTNENITAASRVLGVSRVTLYRLLDKHKIAHMNT